MIVKRYQDSKNLALISVLLMACLPFITFLLPFLVVFLVWGKDEKLIPYALALIVLLIPIIALDYKDGAIILSPISIHTQKVRLVLVALTVCLVLGYRLVGDRPAWGKMALLIAVSLVGYYYFMDYHRKLAEGKNDERIYGGLEDYLKTHSSPNDIVLVEEKNFGAYAIRPHFADYGVMAYATYFGNLAMLQKEISLVWGIELNEDYVKKISSNAKRLHRGMNDFLLSYDEERLKKIKETYPQFNYIVLENDDEFKNPLPVKQVYANQRFKLYKLEL